jgi:hypothetical protein
MLQDQPGVDRPGIPVGLIDFQVDGREVLVIAAAVLRLDAKSIV